MKPHRLRIEAFGPYAEPAEIGFDTLSQEGLFLIHGSTGAGKTFLLDALCFALYGEVSGDRSVKGLRSDHAPAAAVPRVCLEFSTGAGRYLVERSPAYTAPRSRGAGTTDKAAQAVLFRLVGSDRETVVSRSSEVSREVEALVGLNAAQFRQVILLPQGRFAEVLRARAEDREALLKTLFDTVLFEQAGQWLEERARLARIELAKLRTSQEGLRGQAAQAWSADDPAGPTDQQGLDRLVERIAAVMQGTATGLRQAEAALTAAQAGKEAQTRVADRWDRRAAATARLTELEGQRQPIEELQQQLALSERAESLRTSLAAERSSQEALTTLQRSIRQQLLRAIRARDAALALPDPVLLLDLTALPSAEALGQASRALAVRGAELSALARKALEAGQARARASQARTAAAAAGERLERGSTARSGNQETRRQTQEALTAACSARDRLNGLERAAREASEQAAAAAALAPAEHRRQAAAAALAAAERELQRCHERVSALRQAQIAGMAAHLAGGLHAGEACPVCGSTSHPAPAPAGDAAVADAALQAAEQQLNQASQRLNTATAAVATAEAERQAAIERAGPAGEDPVAARTAATAAAEALTEAQTRAQAVASLEQQIHTLDAEFTAIEAGILKLSTRRALDEQTAAEEEARAERLAAEIRNELGDGLDPPLVLQGYAPLEQALQPLVRSCEASAGASSALEQATRRLEQELAGSGFADREAVMAALREESVRRNWATRIEIFQRETAEQRTLLAAPELVDLPEQRPDTGAAAAAVLELDAARTLAVERHTEARRAQAALQRLAEEHRRADTALAEHQERTQLLSAMADRCQGRAAPYISLQRWVLSAYLAEICRYANQRLELMTSGRYRLQLTDEGGRGGRNAGLGLRVLDAYTGEEREVNSLSGGETFQASLALALGVADTVQAHTGGVHLDALFIDEGFGTLDPDNLQLAMDELDRLREGGRMIGIISHVAALRERIRTGIEVLASERGSRLVVGSTGAV